VLTERFFVRKEALDSVAFFEHELCFILFFLIVKKLMISFRSDVFQR